MPPGDCVLSCNISFVVNNLCPRKGPAKMIWRVKRASLVACPGFAFPPGIRVHQSVHLSKRPAPTDFDDAFEVFNKELKV